MSIRYRQFCPISKAAEILGERWTILILRELLAGTTRFRDFQRALCQLSPTLLSKRLQQLQDAGLVVRKNVPGQRTCEYYPTAAARDLQPVILGLGEWGMKWARGQMSDDELDVELLMHDFSRRLDASHLPGGRTVMKFVFPNLSKFANWWIVVDGNGERELCLQNPGTPADIEIRSDLRTMTEVWAGDTSIRLARESGRVQCSGNPDLVRTISSWLRIGTFAYVRPHSDSLKIAGRAGSGPNRKARSKAARASA